MIRPRSVTPEDGLNLESFAYITAYLLEKTDENIDVNTGATPAHDFVANENNLELLDQKLSQYPHYLFMLDKSGQTPLDYSIEEGLKAAQRE